ncbi:MAG: 3'-5' exonuclease [Anaerolineaceae bacterium]|nr:3'-5' exonuclease [Anaerolineaceae bacterium]
MKEFYIVVDIEASGPNPGLYAMLSIGACTLEKPRQTFYVEIQPDKENALQEAMSIHNLSLDELSSGGQPPAEAMTRFAEWIDQVTPADSRPIFTAFNAPFDWMFVCDYFFRYYGTNPFGHKALDIKAFYMGLHDTTWEETSHQHIIRHYSYDIELTHHALSDAIHEADLFEIMLVEAAEKKPEEDV